MSEPGEPKVSIDRGSAERRASLLASIEQLTEEGVGALSPAQRDALREAAKDKNSGEFRGRILGALDAYISSKGKTIRDTYTSLLWDAAEFHLTEAQVEKYVRFGDVSID